MPIWRIEGTTSSWVIDNVTISALNVDITGTYVESTQQWLWSGDITATANIFHGLWSVTVNFNQNGLLSFIIDYEYVVNYAFIMVLISFRYSDTYMLLSEDVHYFSRSCVNQPTVGVVGFGDLTITYI